MPPLRIACIIIDEFQDIARQRFNLTKRLSQITQAKVVAVGDDWQSIYAFSGSDITLFTRFLELMGAGTELKITHTYRNSQELIDIAGGFVQRNTSQIKKQLISPKHLENPIVLEVFDDSVKPMERLADTIEHIVGEIISEYGEQSSILLIGRYNYDMYKLYRTNRFSELPGGAIRSEKYPNAKITFMTAHSSNKNYGLNLWICTNEAELCDFMTNDRTHMHDILKCPKCTDGYLIVKKNPKNGDIFYGCTNYFNEEKKCTYMVPLESGSTNDQ